MDHEEVGRCWDENAEVWTELVRAGQPFGIRYEIASAVELPFESATFDFVAAFMSLMDISETERVLAEVFRVLKPGGFFQFSITHPCFDTPHRKNLRDEKGYTYAIEVVDYFRGREGEVEEWIFHSAPPEVRETAAFPHPRLHADLEFLAEQVGRGGFRTGALR